MSKRKLLYITSVPGRRDLPPLSDATKSVLSVLSRDSEISLADSPAHMVLNLRRLLSEASLWQALSDRSQRIGSTLLAYHEVAHSMRRLLVQVES
mgnify:FL=1